MSKVANFCFLYFLTQSSAGVGVPKRRRLECIKVLVYFCKPYPFVCIIDNLRVIFIHDDKTMHALF